MTIKEFRLSQGLTQPKLAQALGIGVSTIGGYESGRINPSAKVVAKIKEIYGVDLLAPEAPVEEKKPRRKKPVRSAKAKPTEPAPAAEVKPVAEAEPVASAPAVIIQSPLGGEITVEAILSKVGPADKIYVRVDQNAAYWVKGETSGAVELW